MTCSPNFFYFLNSPKTNVAKNQTPKSTALTVKMRPEKVIYAIFTDSTSRSLFQAVIEQLFS